MTKYLKNYKYFVLGSILVWGLVFAPHVLPVSSNLIANSTVETANPVNSSLPQNWNKAGWGTNTRTLSYETNGHSGGRSVKAQIDSYTNGDAKWIFDPVSVSPSTSYTYTDYYQSSTPTELDAQYTSTSGVVTYAFLKAVPASASWSQVSANFTTPANVAKVSIVHIVYSVGWLQTDDFNLTQNDAPPIDNPPVISMTTPTANATLSGTQTLSVDAADDHGVNSVQFKLDGNNLGPADTNAPYTYSWDTTNVADGSHTLTAVVTDTAGQSTTSSPITIAVKNQVAPPPTNNLIPNPSVETADSSGSNPINWRANKWGTNTTTLSYQDGGHSGSKSLKINMAARTNGDAKWIFDPVSVSPSTSYTYTDYYQSSTPTELDAQYTSTSGVVTYAFLKAVPASASWSQVSANFTTPANVAKVSIVHIVYSVGWLQTDDYSLTNGTITSTPSVTLTSPGANSTVSGIVQLTASASYLGGIASVQFQVDGSDVGSPISAIPYQINWDTTKVPNGNHIITAVVTSQDNKTATSGGINVIVSNQPGSNLIQNASLETVSTANSNLPQYWNKSSWGTNTASFSYLATGAHSGSGVVKTQISNYTNGAAYWYPNKMAVTPGQIYDYQDYYESNVTTEVDAVVTMSDGSVQYKYLGDLSPSPNNWTKFEIQFTIPTGAVSVTFYHTIYSVGWLTTDDYSLKTFSYQGFNRPIVSLTFDDGYESFYTNGLPLLQKYGFKSTNYIITSVLGTNPSYMNMAQIIQLNAAGQEIGSHTVTHPDLTTLSAANMDLELKNSQATLQNLLNVPVKSFASPYGAYNNQVVVDAQKYYTSYRGVEPGFNARNNFDAYNILVQDMHATTTLAQVQAWIQQAQTTNTWLVLVYHQVDPSLTTEKYNTFPNDFDAQLSYLQSTGIAVETVAQALAEITQQL